MSVYEIDPLRDSRWADLVEAHPGSSLFHSRPWLEALRQTYGYEPVVFSTSPPQSPLSNGLVLCRVRSWISGRRLVSLPFSDHCEPLVDGPRQFDPLLSHLVHTLNDGTWKSCEIRPASTITVSAPFSAGASYCFHRLDLTQKAEQLFRSFHKDCIQRKIRRAERESLQYQEGGSEQLLREFYRLVLLTRRRQHLPPQPLAWFRALAAAFGPKLKIRLAFKDGRAVAGILTISHRNSMTYKYGCSDAELNRFGGTPFLFWKAIQEAQQNGMQELDMGRSDSGNLGLIAFKEHWGATRSTLNYWQYPRRVRSQESSWKMQLMGRMVAVAPDALLTATANLLYRHIG